MRSKKKTGVDAVKISKKDYFFYEWLIIGKGFTEEKFRQLKPPEVEALKAEYDKFKNGRRT